MAEKYCKWKRTGICFSVILAMILSSCATTRLTGSWVNPDYQDDGFNRILVLGVAESQTYIRILENSLSRQLNKHGIMAEPGYSLFDPEKRPSKEAIAREISNKGFDAMIISKITGRRKEEVVQPGEFYYVREPFFGPRFYSWHSSRFPRYYGQHWYDYYSRSYTLVHEPGYVKEYEIMTVESNIYDARTEELIWSGVTDTVVERDTEDMINSLVNTLISELEKKRLI